MPRELWFPIPAGRRTRRCTSCGAPMFWIDTAAGRKLPVDLAHADSIAPTDTTDGKGQAHFASCPAAASHRTPRTASTTGAA